MSKNTKLIKSEMIGPGVAREFVKAWKALVEDYKKGKINSERCLQSALYAHLRNRLEKYEDLIIYVEPPILLPINGKSEDKKFIDLIVVRRIGEERQILFAAELKYTPRGTPRAQDITADLEKLSFLKNHKYKEMKVFMGVKRHLPPDQYKAERFSIAPRCVVAFALIATERRFLVPADTKRPDSLFWREYGKSFGEGSVWKDTKAFPDDRLLICSALTSDSDRNKVKVLCYGAKQG